MPTKLAAPYRPTYATDRRAACVDVHMDDDYWQRAPTNAEDFGSIDAGYCLDALKLLPLGATRATGNAQVSQNAWTLREYQQ